jgi:PAS domain S-box-containing protein
MSVTHEPPSEDLRAQTDYLEGLSEGFLAYDRNWRIDYVNAAAERFIGRRRDEVLGKTLHEAFAYLLGNVVHQLFERVMSTRTAERLEFYYERIGRWIEISAAPVRSGGIAVYFRDVHDRIEAARLARENEAQLRLADRRKDEFLATLSHELRNPLAPIRTGLHLLKIADRNSDMAEQTRAMMERQMNHLVRLVDDLLEVSRISRGRLDLRRERVALGAVLESAVETSRPLILAAGHELRVSLPPEPLLLDADAVRLAQVVSNLLNNAAKYTRSGGRIALTARREANEALISVRDNGLGIPPDMLGRVFEMFAQVDATLGRSQGGLGIGLTLSKSLVELHGGRIEAHSEGLGKGSEFTLRLPLPVAATAGVASAAQAERAARERGPARHILVVDDNVDAARTLALLLEQMGHRVRIAADGAAALDAARAERPDAILLDLSMPGIDGIEVARRLRADPQLGDVRIIAVTGRGQDDDRRRSRQAGFDEHLVKPIAPEALLDAIERFFAS